jgi:hypothetical protein
LLRDAQLAERVENTWSEQKTLKTEHVNSIELNHLFGYNPRPFVWQLAE